MTATRDRRGDLDDDHAVIAWHERPIAGRWKGLPWWGAIVLAFGLTIVAAIIDMQVQNSLGRVFQVAYVLGCVGAVCAVRRANLFGPMVQPPLVFAVVSIGAVLLLGPSTKDGGLKSLLFSVAVPLTSNFPTMAITTLLAVGIGVARMFLQRDPNRHPSPPSKRPRPEADEPAERKPAATRPPADRKPRDPSRPREGARPREGGRPRPNPTRQPPRRRPEDR